MKFMKSLTPTDPDYAELLAQKAAHKLYFSKNKQERESHFGKHLLKGTIALFSVMISVTFPCSLVWNLSIIATLAAFIFL